MAPGVLQMNYASLIIVAFLVVSVGYWFARGRYEYVGPRTHKPPVVDGNGVATSILNEAESTILKPHVTVPQDRALIGLAQLAKAAAALEVGWSREDSIDDWKLGVLQE